MNGLTFFNVITNKMAMPIRMINNGIEFYFSCNRLRVAKSSFNRGYRESKKTDSLI
jgi:hypothetical protein